MCCPYKLGQFRVLSGCLCVLFDYQFAIAIFLVFCRESAFDFLCVHNNDIFVFLSVIGVCYIRCFDSFVQAQNDMLAFDGKGFDSEYFDICFECFFDLNQFDAFNRAKKRMNRDISVFDIDPLNILEGFYEHKQGNGK